jgi:ubiquinone/menaquinone biosynthesis C-methylase UbiE
MNRWDDNTTQIQADFDRLAQLAQDEWGHNSHYHAFLLEQIPASCENVLEIGCGTGRFSRLLAARVERVIALDLSPEMIRLARERSRHYDNIDYQVADAVTWTFPKGGFDAVVSIATLHHLPLKEMLLKIGAALKPGGTLLVLDLYQEENWQDWLTGLLATPVSILLRLVKQGRLRQPRAVREAWAQHGQHDRYLTLREIRHTCRDVLPGAQVRRHLLWRYSIVWRG